MLRRLYGDPNGVNQYGFHMELVNLQAYEVHEVISDEEGGFLIMDVTLGEQWITVVHLYRPNKDDTTIFTNIMDLVENLPNDNRIFGGDFNVILDLEFD